MLSMTYTLILWLHFTFPHCQFSWAQVSLKTSPLTKHIGVLAFRWERAFLHGGIVKDALPKVFLGS